MWTTFERADTPLRQKMHCPRCQKYSIHSQEACCKGYWQDDDSNIEGGTSYSIFKCGGCDEIAFVSSEWFSEDWSQDDLGRMVLNYTIKQYPSPTPTDINIDTSSIPSKLKDIIDELIYAYNGNKLILSCIALRMAIEYITIDKKCKGKRLANKINTLFEMGIINEDQRNLLQFIRIQGNKSAHEALSMNASSTRVSIKVIGSIIDKLYNIPAKQSSILHEARTKLIAHTPTILELS